MLGARITLKVAELPPGLAQMLLRAFTHRNQQHEKLKRMGYGAQREPREICTAWDYRAKGYIQLPRGGYKRFLRIMRDHGYAVRWDDKRVKLPKAGLQMGLLQMRSNQEEAPLLLMRNQQGLLRGGTGVGKTETLLASIVAADQPALIIVWNKDLLKQWVFRITEKYKILKPHQLGIFGAGRKTFGPITIGMQQTLVRHLSRDLANRFGTVAMDECHRAPAQTFMEVVNYFPAFYRWGATADEKRQDQKEFITYDSFGEMVFEIHSQETTHDPMIRVVPTRYEDLQYEEDKKPTDFVTRLVADKDRNELIARVLRERLKAGRRVLLFTDRVEAALYWVEVVNSWGVAAGPLIGGSDYAVEVQQTLKGIADGSVRMAAATTYADVGLDMPILDSAFITCPIASHVKRLNQQVGRVVRKHEAKADAEVLYFWDRKIDGMGRRLKLIQKRWKNVRIEEQWLREMPARVDKPVDKPKPITVLRRRPENLEL